MATAKKTTTAKKTVAPKKVEAKKPAPVDEAVKSEEVEEPVDKIVNIILPKDPMFPEDQQYWEISINGIMQRFPRGRMIELPQSIVDLYNFKASLLRQGRAQYGAFENGSARIG